MWRAFDPVWFTRWQRVLLWLLDAPLLGRWSRWVLCIRPQDVGYRGRIIQLLPHAYIVANPDGSRTLDVRTHPKFAKRIYYAFRPLWWTLHGWDALLADRFAPAWSFGFATLTQYPDPDPETTTVDGQVDQFGLNTTWATVRAAAGNFSDGSVPSGPFVKFVASATSNQWAEIARSIFLFDTSPLSAAATVTAAVLSLYGSGGKRDDNSNTPDADIYTSTPASNTALVNGDFAQIGTTSQTGSPISFAAYTDGAYNDFTLNATGRGNVSKTSVSKFGARNANRDVANSAPPTWASGTLSELRCYFADQTGTTNDPKLVVTYTLPIALTGSTPTATWAPPVGVLYSSALITLAKPVATWTVFSGILYSPALITLAKPVATWTAAPGTLGRLTASIRLEMELTGRGNGWTEVKDWRVAQGLQWDRGFPGNGVADCIADSGTLRFVLNNSRTNTAGLVGYYSPDHANCRAGFQLRIGVRVRLIIGTTSYVRFTGYLDHIAPEPGIYRGYGVECEALGWMGMIGETRLTDLPILLDAPGETVFQTIIDGLPDFVQPRAVEKDLSADVYPYVLDRIRDEQTVARDELYRLALSGLDRVWERGDGTVVYESRTRRTKVTTNIDAFSDSHGLAAVRSSESVANSAQTTVHPRLVSPVTDAVLFSLNQPLQIAPNQTIEMLGPWTDSNNPDVRVGAVSLVSLVAGVDYVANTAEDGSGYDLTGSLTVAVGLSGNATQFTLTLGGSSAGGWVTILQQRGQALLDYGPIPATQLDEGSIDRYGLNPLNLDLPYQANANFGIELAQYIIFLQGEPLTEVAGFRRVVGLTNTTELARSVARDLSERIGLTDTVTGIAASYFIERITETLYPTHLVTEFSLSRPIDTRTFWQLEIAGRTELDFTTRLGFGLIIGHTDLAHLDTHSDIAHGDVTHVDTHTDNPLQNQLHGDGPTHGDSVHSDAAHSDIAYVSHSDAHSDDIFQDRAHGDSHTDSPHTDAHGDSFQDFNNAVYQVSFADHGDTHSDIAHGDGHSDVAHLDEAHEDGHGDTAGVSHGDVAHSDVAHNDASGHSDVAHADSPHGDIAHSDTAHTDVTHGDGHGDTAHGDAN